MIRPQKKHAFHADLLFAKLHYFAPSLLFVHLVDLQSFKKRDGIHYRQIPADFLSNLVLWLVNSILFGTIQQLDQNLVLRLVLGVLFREKFAGLNKIQH